MKKEDLPPGVTVLPTPEPKNTETPEQIEAKKLHQAIAHYSKIISLALLIDFVGIVGVVLGFIINVPLLIYISSAVVLAGIVIIGIYSDKKDVAQRRIIEIGWDIVFNFLFKMSTKDENQK